MNLRQFSLKAIVRATVLAVGLSAFACPRATFAADGKYYHWQDKGTPAWTGGALNSTNSAYYETDVVPHYIEASKLTVGAQYTFNIYYDWYDASKNICGFGYLATYNQSRSPSTPGGTPSQDDALPGGDGYFYTTGADITSATGPYDSGISRYVTVAFTATASNAYIYWGLYLSPPGTQGTCSGAGSWSGASLQTWISGGTLSVTGNMQINNGVLLQASIRGIKFEDLNADGDRDEGESTLGGWTIQLCGDSSCSIIKRQTSTSSTDGSYILYAGSGTWYVREVDVTGDYWEPTYPKDPAYHTVSISSGGVYSPYDFGNHHHVVDLKTTKTASVQQVQWKWVLKDGEWILEPIPFYYTITVENLWAYEDLTASDPNPAALVTDDLPDMFAPCEALQGGCPYLPEGVSGALPDGCSYAEPTSGWPTTYGEPYGGVLTCDIKSLQRSGQTGASVPFEIWVTTHPDGYVVGDVRNEACVTLTSYANQEETVLTNNCGFVYVTTPVTLAYFRATRDGRTVRFDWQTATEKLNAGFNLVVQTASGPQKVNDQLIRSAVVNSVVPQDYEFTASDVAGDVFYIEDVDVRGRTQLHGPFVADEPHGVRASVKPPDWSAIAAEHEAKAAQRSIRERRQNASIVTALRTVAATGGYPPYDLLVDKDGLYRVTYEDLKAAGLDLAGVAQSSLAVTNRGAPVPIASGGPDPIAPGSFIEFHGQALDTLYTRTNVYRLLVDGSLARRVGTDATKLKGKVTTPKYYMETVTVNNDRQYTDLSPNGDPWYDEWFYVVGSEPWTWGENGEFPIAVDKLVAGTAPSVLRVHLYGSSELVPGPDHHVQIALNGTTVADASFDAFEVAVVEASLPPGVLLEGANTMQVTLPADLGAAWDMSVLDRYSITYPRAFVARDGRLTFTAAASAFQVTNLPSGDLSVYRVVNGTPTRLTGLIIAGTAGSYGVTFPGSSQAATYLVAAQPGLLVPKAVPGRPMVDISSGMAEYLAISHPDFIDGLSPLVAARQAQGLSVKVVDVRDVYAQFSYGIVDPRALRDYIAYAARNMGTRYVLLVGDDTYDYFGNYDAGTPHYPSGISFIPTPFVAYGDITFLPADPQYADINDDGVPDVALGRLPVRTSAELARLIGKMLTYELKTYRRTAVFAAHGPFIGASETAADALEHADWNVERAYYLDKKVNTTEFVEARLILQSAINAGVALTNFFGHSGLTVWTFDGLFTRTDAKALRNVNRPTIASQWGCYNTYYLEPTYDTLNDLLLLYGSAGAAATLGATSIAEYGAERDLAGRLTPRLAQPGMTIGEAMVEAKAELASVRPGLVDVQLGWTLLGDPAMVIEPAEP